MCWIKLCVFCFGSIWSKCEVQSSFVDFVWITYQILKMVFESPLLLWYFFLLVLLFWDRIPLQPLLAWNSWSSCLCVLGAGQACATSPSSQPLLCLNPSTSCKSLAFAPYAEVSHWCGAATASSWQTDPFDFCRLSIILNFKSLCLVMSLHHYSVSLFVDYLLSFHLVCMCR